MAELARGNALVMWDSEVVFLQPANFVAEARGFLELEVGGGLAHALLEVADVGFEIMADEVRPVFVAGVDGESLRARSRVP